MGERIGYPVLVRPSYVLGGRAMVIAYDAEAVANTCARRWSIRRSGRCWWITSWRMRSRWMWMRFATREDVMIAGIMQHIEEAGIHSGDSSCVLPAVTFARDAG